jgi:hypothetical protein
VVLQRQATSTPSPLLTQLLLALEEFKIKVKSFTRPSDEAV